MMVLKIFEKIIQNFMDHLKEINQRRNVLEPKLYDASQNEHLTHIPSASHRLTWRRPCVVMIPANLLTTSGRRYD